MPRRPVSPPAEPATSAPPKRLGFTEPRIFTPPLRELTPETSLGFDVIDFAQQDLGVTLHPYQKWLYVHALELLPDGNFRFRTIIVLIARQNGKTTWWKILVLYAMCVLGMKLVMSTAQDLDTAEGTWQEVVDWVLEQDDDTEQYAHPDLAEMVDRVVQKNGSKSLDLLTGEKYKAKAANRRAGRGKSAELIGLDELREQQNWDSWSAITHTTMARERALHVGLSNAGDLLSVVLRYFRMIAHLALGDPDGINQAEEGSAAQLLGQSELDDEQIAELEDEDDDTLGIFEYSAPPGCAINNWDGIAQANPALNHPNGISERAVRAAMKEPEWSYRTEVLCQWPDGTLTGPFPAGAWSECAAKKDRAGRLPPAERIVTAARVTACLEVSRDRGAAWVGAAGHRADEHVQVEVVANRPGVAWVLDWFTDPQHPERARWQIALRQGSPAWTLRTDLIDAGLDVVEWKGSDVGVGCGILYDDVRTRELRHTDQPVLNVPAGTAVTKPLERGLWVWDGRRSPHDVASLYAVTGARWLLAQEPETPPPARSLPQAVTAAALPRASAQSDVAHAAF